ncbi:N,N-dimethylformamidase beta subunit family domain-containing protein [Nonomuraea indica]|uniref:N,N-dimethylformamidase beta subunit family domain-containing protein n=1 Tax=Nonomuraea indica TaxID=1581193 RepID=UPI000C7B98D1|nr:N,N-dimethylformamidase beta subunit family domain-containing protein [Nonomuraea indica]
MRKPIAALALLALGCGAAAPDARPGEAAGPRTAAPAAGAPAEPGRATRAAAEAGRATRAAAKAGRATGAVAKAGRATGAVAVGAARAAGARERASWRITRRGAEHEIEGYADRVSVLPGERFRLLVSTTAPAFTARAFRMGARPTPVWRSGPLPGVRQPPALVVEDMVTAAHWRPSVTVDTTGWPEGAYLVRLDASTGAQRYVPVTVRSASTRGRVVLVNAVTTWQAYNGWGGRSLYQGPGGFAGRSRKITFDRPYDGTGARHFLAFERDAIAVAERSGVPLAYLTSLDLRPGALDGARAVVSLGHDEYYSPGMRAALTRARDRGVNLAFLGAGAVFWRIALHGRMIMCDKESRCLPWQASEPESALVGQGFDCYPAEGAYVVGRPGHWIFEGTRGRRFPGLAGVETDRVSPRSPAGVQVLARSPVDCAGRATEGTTTYYTAPSGAGVFAAGTTRWVCGMRGRRCRHGVTGAAAAFTRRATRNLLTRFAEGPAARPGPSRPASPAAGRPPGEPS